MNIVDIVILICFVVGAFMGFRDGAIRQAGGLIGVVVAIVAANKFGSLASSTLHFGGDYAHIWGFVIVLILCLIAVGAATTLLKKLISAVGLGIFDRLLGAAIGIVVCGLILSLLFFCINLLPIDSSALLGESKLYPQLQSASQYITPAMDWVGEQIPSVDGE